MVQSVLNPFTISIILQKSRQKNEQKQAKSTQIRPFSDLFQAFSGTLPIRHIIALAIGPQWARYGRYAHGIAQVWKRYEALP